MIWFYCSCALLFILKTSSAADTLLPNQILKDGDETIVSASENFELGFFTRKQSLRYLGIMYYKKGENGTVVWVANREVPFADPMGTLKFTDNGTLQLVDVNNTIIWSSQPSKTLANISPVAQLLDNGNLVIKDNITGAFIWESFDHPGNTWLPGMKLGVDLVTGIHRNLTSWTTRLDPSPGSYTVSIDVNGYPQLYITNTIGESQQRVGSANGLGFTGMNGLIQNNVSEHEFVYKKEEMYIMFTLLCRKVEK
ncbi:putative bulb-type lectin domain-containing protein [Helianthus annuus]|nr:putative bulb-type lectin domain-containing protein [Helianthus annuus]